MPEAPRAGHRTFWREFGSGPRPALALHCSLAHSGALTQVLEPLRTILSCVAPDLPGHGRSDVWDGRGHLQDLVLRIVEDFLSEIDGKVDLIGHSFGGTVLLRVAHSHRDRIRSLTLYEPPFYDALRKDHMDVLEAQLARDAAAAKEIRARNWDAAAPLFGDEWGPPGGWARMTPEQRDYVTARMYTIEDAGITLNRDFAGILGPGVMEALDLPVLFMRGDQSPPAITAIAGVFVARLPRCEEVVIPGAGHMGPVTHPGPVSDAIAGFLSLT